MTQPEELGSDSRESEEDHATIEEVAAATDKDDSKTKSGKKWGILPKKKSGT